jgi:uncharacterized RDD family membrane protein YckC
VTFREVVTPEGVPLRFNLAGAGDRVGAFAIDCAILLGACLGLLVVAILATVTTRGLGIAISLLAFFLLRNFYFTWFECRAAGATPGKRLLGLRVIDAHGGMLTPEAVFARNFMREIELFVPLVAVLAPEALLPGVPAWARLLATAWLFVFALLPLFNRDRLRVGDLVGGTLVVRAPKAVLLEDLSAAPRAGAAAPSGLTFTPEQLDLYGIQELKVLEGLLRQKTVNFSALEAVARKIQHKIGWRPPAGRVDPEAFLRAFYTAQRARLEQRMLLGERREAKRPGRATRRP